jgi:uncharacterized membrane protein YsdA (DUF1294 family)
MLTLHSILLGFHILFGAMALVLFWMPVIMKKGSLDHIKYGRNYAKVMYTVAATGAIMAILVLMDPLMLKSSFITAETDLQAFVTNVRAFWLFLLYLCLLTFAGIRHGLLVLRVKAQRQRLRSPLHVLTLLALLIGGIALLSMGLIRHNTLHTIFGVLGTAIGTQMLRYCFAKQINHKQWLVEHLTSFIGTGIGAYTAFLAFGGRSLFSGLGEWQIIFWITPGLIGGIASGILSRNYKAKPVTTLANTANSSTN